MPTAPPMHRAQPKARPLPRKREEHDRVLDTAAWRKLSRSFLQRHPICTECWRAASVQVHHIKSREDRPDLIFTESNLAAMCISCHNQQRIDTE